MIPFYESYEWTTLPRIDVVLNTQLCRAYDNAPKGDSWRVKRGQRQIRGLFNGQDYEFKLTHNKGRGDADRHYLYFELGGKQYFVHVGERWPDAIDISTGV